MIPSSSVTDTVGTFFLDHGDHFVNVVCESLPLRSRDDFSIAEEFADKVPLVIVFVHDSLDDEALTLIHGSPQYEYEDLVDQRRVLGSP